MVDGNEVMTMYTRITSLLLGTIILFMSPILPKHFHEPLGKKENINLAWNGTTLMLTGASDNTLGLGESPDIPADIKPLFFAKIPINDASIELLMTIPGIGPKTANRIIELRSVRKRYTSADELLIIKGIGRKKLRILQKYLSFVECKGI